MAHFSCGVKAIIFGFVLPFTLLYPPPSHSHNGAVAIAVPVEGIVVDGHLDDWPQGMRRYPIAMPESGDRPKSKDDYRGSFRIGYSARKNALYVAVEVVDESTMIDTTAQADRNTQDGCGIHVGVEHGEEDSPAVQYMIQGAARHAGAYEVEVDRREKVHRYEWQIDIGGMSQGQTHLHSGMMLGMDIAVSDKDEDGSFSLMAWGRGDRGGDVVFVEENVRLGKIHGKVRWADAEEGIARAMVEIQSSTSDVALMVETDRAGAYAVDLPEGRYDVSVVELGRGEKERIAAQVKEGTEEEVELVIRASRGQMVPAGPGKRHWQTFGIPDGLSSLMINAISEDREGRLWFGTLGGGVSRYDGETFTTFTTQDGLAHNEVYSILEDREGQLWFGTWSDGVSRYDGETFTNFTTQDGLAHNWVYSILEDREGRLWFGTLGGGVSQYDGFVFQHLLSRDGLAHDGVHEVYQDREGSIWIGTMEGITRYRPRHTPPLISLTRIVADRRYGPVENIRLPSSQPFLMIEFQGLSYKTRPEAMVYLYRLKGYEEEWQQTHADRVEYTDLPVGQYEFQVKAVDRDLDYSEEPAALSVEVYYQPVSSSIRISELNVQDVFASFYKTYAEKPIGSALVTNDDPTQIEATLSFYIPDHMSRPTEQTVLLDGRSSQVVSLHAILDKEILDFEGAIPVQAEVSLSCELGKQTFSIRESQNITVYGRGALTWDNLGRAAAFVTPEDHSVSAFSRILFEEYRSHIKKRTIDGNIPTAMLLFEALNAHGIKYARDASTPYSQVRGNRSAIDNIQYPGELLQSKMGDCDDCTVLYCALLENLDIPTALIDHPNHILMMFDSGIAEDQYFGFSLDEDRYVERDGRFWIPIEVTKLGEGSFIEAWELGARTCQRLQNMDELVTDVRKVWPEYPYALPSIEEEIVPPDSEELERAFVDDMEQLQAIREEFVEKKYIGPLLQNPEDHQRRMELAHTLIQSGDFNGAISTLTPLLSTDFKPEAYYLIGFSYAGKKSFQEAVLYIEKALEHDPENRGYQYSLEVLRGEQTR